MKCPNCGADNNKVTDTKHKGDFQLRRRKCFNCGVYFKTREFFVDKRVTTRPMPTWVKRKELEDGRDIV